MRTYHRSPNLRRFLWGLAVVAGLTACAPRETVVIYITPTQQTDETQTMTLIPTLDMPPSLAAAETPTEIVTDAPFLMPTPQLAATSTPVAPLASPTLTGESATLAVSPGATFGAIIDANYTLPPSSTPRPTATNTPVNTPIATSYPTWPTLDGSRMGLQLYDNVPLDYWYTLTVQTRDSGVGWIKMQANWAALQPNGPDEYGESFQRFVDYVQRVNGQGLRVLLSVVKAPAWARSVRDEDGPPDDPQSYARFLTFLIERVKPEFVDAIEIWNEPNLAREWRGTLPFTGAGYMTLFAPAYDAVRAADPQAIIITAGLAPTGDSDGSADDRTYMQQMYDAGLSRYPDVAVGVHPYGWGNPPDFRCCDVIAGRGWDDDPHFFFLDNLDDYRAIMVANGHENVQMWVTEFGWATWTDYNVPHPPGEDWMLYTTPEEQAQYVVRAFQIGQARPDVGVMILWNMNFGTQTLIGQQIELAAYSLIYDIGEGLRYRPLFGVLPEIVTPPQS